jgi:hypothetical protein
MAQIIVKANVVVPNGPQFAFNETLEVDAYDKIDVAVEAGASGKKIELQPGAAGQVQFITIVSDWYGDDLSFKINVGTAANTDAFPLDRPLLFMGEGAVALFDAAPKLLFFSNATSAATAKDANIQILIGRDATP